MLSSGTMFTSGNGDTIIAMPYGKWFPKFQRNLPNEMMDLQLTKVKKTDAATGDGTLFMGKSTMNGPFQDLKLG